MHKKVTGIGGVFIKCKNPVDMRNWYAKNLGFNTDQYGTSFVWRNIDEPAKKGYTVWSTFAENTKYFEPSTKDFMINLRVENLDWLLSELKKDDINQIGETQVYEYGKFAHIIDPEGNKIELWEANDTEFAGIISPDAITK